MTTSLIDNATAYPLGITELATTDTAMAGPGGTLNVPHQELANRTAFIKASLATLINSLASIAVGADGASEIGAESRDAYLLGGNQIGVYFLTGSVSNQLGMLLDYMNLLSNADPSTGSAVGSASIGCKAIAGTRYPASAQSLDMQLTAILDALNNHANSGDHDVLYPHVILNIPWTSVPASGINVALGTYQLSAGAETVGIQLVVAPAAADGSRIHELEPLESYGVTEMRVLVEGDSLTPETWSVGITNLMTPAATPTNNKWVRGVVTIHI